MENNQISTDSAVEEISGNNCCIEKHMEEKPEKECCCHRKKARTSEQLRSLNNRLSRIEGQLRGIRKMLEEDAYCPDILTQTSAAAAALNAFGRELLAEHIHSCVRNDILAGRDETIDELLDTLRKMMK